MMEGQRGRKLDLPEELALRRAKGLARLDQLLRHRW